MLIIGAGYPLSWVGFVLGLKRDDTGRSRSPPPALDRPRPISVHPGERQTFFSLWFTSFVIRTRSDVDPSSSKLAHAERPLLRDPLLVRLLLVLPPVSRWIITDRSPCQDLTFAGPYKDLLRLAGTCSRYFLSYRAFYRLLNIDLMLPDKHLWSPSDFGY